jgi:hypothetical protein
MEQDSNTKSINRSSPEYPHPVAAPIPEDEKPVAAVAVATALPQAETNILEKIATFIRRFVFLQHDELYDLVAVWVIGTYLTVVFDYVGYIFAYSPEPQSGKSRLLEVLELLVHNPSGILIAPTEAVLFRTADGTQLLDEVDSWRNKDELKSVLNAGFRRGGIVTRMRDEDSGYKAERFPVYGPRALAGIGTKILDVTTRDRCFMVEMVRQKKGERRDRLQHRRIKPEVDELKKSVEEWANANRNGIAKLYDEFDFPYLQELRDRSIDIAQPLATIIEVAYSGSPKIRVSLSRLMNAVAVTRDEERSAEGKHKVLRQLIQVTAEDPLVGSPSELSELCAQLLADAPSAEMITRTLRQYGFVTKSCRKGLLGPRQRYELPKAKLAEILARYGAEEWEAKGFVGSEKPGAQEEVYATQISGS